MIQRIQTVYLILTTFIAILFLSGDIFSFENGTSLSFTGMIEKIGSTNMENVGHNWFLIVLLFTIPVLSFVLVLLYKKRKLQLKMTLLLIGLILVTCGTLGYYCYDYLNNSSTEIVLSYRLILPLLMLIFSILAYRGIRKDEEIVRSYDRLR